jgi:CO/xanthine dehydrogenase FAD-binding subunit
MQRFRYARAESVSQAVELLNERDVISRVLAGGTDLLLQLRQARSWPDRVVDISQIATLHQIVRRDDTVWIGAATTFSEVIESQVVMETAPLLLQVARQVGATQVRNMGTLGGNVVNAAACADSLPALVCLDTSVHVTTPSGEFSHQLADFVTGPNRTCLPAGALVTALSYVVPPEGSRSVFVKLGRRNAMAISRLTIACLGRLDADGRIAEARLAPGSVTPRVQRLAAVEQFLVGKQPTRTNFDEAAGLAVKEVARITGQRWSSPYKEPVLQTLASRALAQVFGVSMDERRSV